MTSILIIGNAKSGTTALYSMIKAALPQALNVYEPSTKNQFDFIERHASENKLAKSLYDKICYQTTMVDFFDCKVHMVRDFRDIVVSYLLYLPLLGGVNEKSSFMQGFVGLLKEKESNPGSVSLRKISNYLEKNGIRVPTSDDYKLALKYSRHYEKNLSNSFLIKYEQLLANDLTELESYLGFGISRKAELSPHLSYNARQKKSGVWKDWFTDEDVEYYMPLLQPLIREYNYIDDWTLPKIQKIESQFSSEYIERSANRLRLLPNRFGDLKKTTLYTKDYIAHLEHAKSNGAEGAMIELALANLAGLISGPDLKLFENNLAEAVDRQNPLALIYAGASLELGIIDLDRFSQPYELLYRNAALQIGNLKAKRWIEKARFELKKIMG
jgi:hypothetical protein